MTGYGVKFLCYFKEVDTGTLYRIRFYFRGYSGSAEEINGGDDPFSYEVGDDERTGPKYTKAQIRLFLPKTKSLSDFYAESDRDIFVTLDYLQTGNGSIETDWKREFTGWASPFDAREPYGKAPYPVAISVTCGLNSLADFPFYSYPLARQLAGPQRLLDLIFGALAWIGYEIPVWVSVRIFEESMLAGGSLPAGAYDPLKNARLHTLRFKSDGQWNSCKDVIADVLKCFDAVLLQDEGVWKILCVGQVPDTLSGRQWIKYSDFTQDTGILATENPVKILNKLADGTPLRGATLGFEPAIRKYELTFDYGDPVNILRNGDFSSGLEQWQGTAITGGAAAATGNGDDTNPYGLTITGTTTDKAQDSDNLYAYSEITLPYDPQKPMALTVSGVFVNTNCAGMKVMVQCVAQYNTAQPETVTVFYLQDDGSWKNRYMDRKVPFYRFQKNDYQDGQVFKAKPTSGENFTFDANSLPVWPLTGATLVSYRIRIFLYRGLVLGGQTQTPTPKITFRDLKVSVRDATRVVLKKEVIQAGIDGLDIRERRKSEDIALSVGDQTSAIGGAGTRYGAILRINGQTTRKWYMSLSGGGMRTGKIQNLCAFMALRATAKQGRSIEGDFKGRFGPLSVLNAQELGINFWPLRYRRSVRTRTINIRAVQIQDVRSGVSIAGEYEGEGGIRLPMTDPTNTETVVLPGGSLTGSASGALQDILKRIGLIKLKGVVEPINDPLTGAQVGNGTGVIEDQHGNIVQVTY